MHSKAQALRGLNAPHCVPWLLPPFASYCALQFSVGLALCLAFATSGLKATQDAAIDTRNSTEPRPLPPELVDEVSAKEAEISSWLNRPADPAAPEAYRTLIPIAEAIIEQRSEHQGTDWWETVDARLQLENLKRWLIFSDEERRDMQGVVAAGDQTRLDYQAGRFQEAIAGIKSASEIERRVLGDTHLWVTTSLANLASAYRDNGQYADAEKILRELIPQATGILGSAHPYRATLLDNFAQLLVELGELSEAEFTYREALSLRRTLLGESHPNYAITLNNLGMLYSDQGRFAEAEPLLRQSIEIWRTTYGESHPLVATALNRLGSVYENQRRFAEAETAYRAAIDLRRSHLGESHPDYAATLNNLSQLYSRQSRFDEALPLLQQALDIWRTTYGESHTLVATALNNLGNLFLDQGLFLEADTTYLQALDLRRSLLGESHPDFAMTLNNLGQLYLSQGRFPEAEPLMLQALEIWRKSYGESHPLVGTALNNLGNLYDAQGLYSFAEPLFRQALALRRTALDPSHSDIAGSLNDLATNILEHRASYAEAESMLDEAIRIWRQNFGDNHVLLARATNNLAVVRLAQGRIAEAVALDREALEIRRKIFGEVHPEVARSLNNLAVDYMQDGRPEDAEPLLRQAQQINERIFGLNYPSRGKDLNNLGMLLASTGRVDEAEQLIRDAIAHTETELGSQHADLASWLTNLADLLLTQSRFDEASALYSKALAIRRHSLGSSHPDLAGSLRDVGFIFLRGKNFPEAETAYREAAAIARENPGVKSALFVNAVSGLALSVAAQRRHDEAAELMLEGLQAQWHLMSEMLPLLPDDKKRELIAQSRSSDAGYDTLAHILFLGDASDPIKVLRAVLLGKNLVNESIRVEGAALREAVSSAPPEWQERWIQREQLARAYAQTAISAFDHDYSRADSRTLAPEEIKDLQIRLEQIDTQLRNGNPAYSEAARLIRPEFDDVRAGLRDDEALLEFIRYEAWEDDGSKTPRYGVFVLRRNGHTTSIDLGVAEPIDGQVTAVRQAVGDYIAQWKSNLQLTPRARDLRRLLSEDSLEPGTLSESRTAQANARLREQIWNPIAPFLNGVTRVYVAPDSYLGLVPFEALSQQDKNGSWRYLIEDFQIVYLNTGRDLARLATTVTHPVSSTAALVGNPEFSADPHRLAISGHQLTTHKLAQATPATSVRGTLGVSAGMGALRTHVRRDWSDIPELRSLLDDTREQLSSLGWRVESLQREQATKAAVLNLSQPRILQFATHGFAFDSSNEAGSWDNPMLRSLLLLSGVNRWNPESSTFYRFGERMLTRAEALSEGLEETELAAARIEVDNGVLTAYEVTGMDLRGTELVSLTACETGVGDVTADGVTGLRQAFLLAGARSVTASLWEVPSQETVNQTRDFYRRWLSPQTDQAPPSRYEAFRAAQLAALDRARKEQANAHPFFWAGTIYIGDPGDLPASDSSEASTP